MKLRYLRPVQLCLLVAPPIALFVASKQTYQQRPDQAIVGKWRTAGDGTTTTFSQDGTLVTVTPRTDNAETLPSSRVSVSYGFYRFKDSRHLVLDYRQVSMASQPVPMEPGQRPVQITIRILGDTAQVEAGGGHPKSGKGFWTIRLSSCADSPCLQ